MSVIYIIVIIQILVMVWLFLGLFRVVSVVPLSKIIDSLVLLKEILIRIYFNLTVKPLGKTVYHRLLNRPVILLTDENINQLNYHQKFSEIFYLDIFSNTQSKHLLKLSVLNAQIVLEVPESIKLESAANFKSLKLNKRNQNLSNLLNDLASFGEKLVEIAIRKHQALQIIEKSKSHLAHIKTSRFKSSYLNYKIQIQALEKFVNMSSKWEDKIQKVLKDYLAIYLIEYEMPVLTNYVDDIRKISENIKLVNIKVETFLTSFNELLTKQEPKSVKIKSKQKIKAFLKSVTEKIHYSSSKSS